MLQESLNDLEFISGLLLSREFIGMLQMITAVEELCLTASNVKGVISSDSLSMYLGSLEVVVHVEHQWMQLPLPWLPLRQRETNTYFLLLKRDQVIMM